MRFSAGDRIRMECTGEDGLPLFRYGKPGLQPGVDLLDKDQMADLAGDDEPRAVS